MNVDFVKLKDYLEYKEENIFIKGFWYSIIVSVLLILVIVFSSYQKKNLYYESILVVTNNSFFVNVNYNDYDLINNNHEIIINDRLYNYWIKDVIFDNNTLNYQFELSFNNSLLKMDDGILLYKIFLSKESILEYLVRIVKEGS